MNSLCKSFRVQAGRIWKQMSNAAQCGMALSEETITEMALYQIAFEYRNSSKFKVELATKPAEAKHGADWELWLLRKNKNIHFRVQAKRLFPDGTYRHLTKAGGAPYAQLDKLVASAVKSSAIPLYCFYNFEMSPNPFASVNCSHVYRMPSYWGCSLAYPASLKAAGSIALADLHTQMVPPWHQLVCAHDDEDLVDAGKRLRLRAEGDSEVDAAQPIPGYVEELRRRRTHAATTGTFLNDDFWIDEPVDSNVAGIAVLDDLRS